MSDADALFADIPRAQSGSPDDLFSDIPRTPQQAAPAQTAPPAGPRPSILKQPGITDTPPIKPQVVVNGVVTQKRGNNGPAPFNADNAVSQMDQGTAPGTQLRQNATPYFNTQKPVVPTGSAFDQVNAHATPSGPQLKIGTGPRADAAYAGYIHAITPMAKGGLGQDPEKASLAYRQSQASITTTEPTGGQPYLDGTTYAIHPGTFEMLPFTQQSWQHMLDTGANIIQGKNGGTYDRATAERLYSSITKQQGPFQGAPDLYQRENQINEAGMSPNAGNKLLGSAPPMTLKRAASDLAQAGQKTTAAVVDAGQNYARLLGLDPTVLLPSQVGKAVKGVATGVVNLANPLSIAGIGASVLDDPIKVAEGVRDMLARIGTPSEQTPEEYFENLVNAALIVHGITKVPVSASTKAAMSDAIRRSVGGDMVGKSGTFTEENAPLSSSATASTTPLAVPTPSKLPAENLAPKPTKGQTVDQATFHALNRWRPLAEAEIENSANQIEHAPLTGADPAALRQKINTLRNALDTNTPDPEIVDRIKNAWISKNGEPNPAIKITVDPTEVPKPDPHAQWALDNWQQSAGDELTKAVQNGDWDRAAEVRRWFTRQRPPQDFLENLAQQHAEINPTSDYVRKLYQDSTPEEQTIAANSLGIPHEQLEPAIESATDHTGAAPGETEPTSAKSGNGVEPPSEPANPTDPGTGPKPVAEPAINSASEPVSASPTAEPKPPTAPPALPREEVTPPPVDPQYSAKNAVSDVRANQLGVEPTERSPRTSYSEDMDAGREALLSGRINGDALAKDLIKTRRPATPVEQGALLTHQMVIDTRLGEIDKEAAATSDPMKLQLLKDEKTALEGQAAQNIEALTRTGTALGRGLGFRRGMHERPLDTPSILADAKMTKGSELSPKETTKATELGEKIKTARQNLKNAEDATAGKVVRDAPKGKFNRADLKAERTDILNQFGQLGSRLSANPIDMIPKGMELLGKLAVNLAKEGFISIDDLLGKVQSALKPHGIDVTRDHLIDALSQIKPRPEMSDATKNAQAARLAARTYGKAAELNESLANGTYSPAEKSPSKTVNEDVALARNQLSAASKEARQIDLAKKTTQKAQELKESLDNGTYTPPTSKVAGFVRPELADARALFAEAQKEASARNLASKLRSKAAGIKDALDNGTYTEPAPKARNEVHPDVAKARVELQRQEAQAKHYIKSLQVTPASELIRQAYRASIVSNIPKIAAKVLGGFSVGKVVDSLGAIPAKAWDEMLHQATGIHGNAIDIQAVMDGLKDAKTRATLGRFLNVLKGIEPASAHTGLSDSFHGVNGGESKIGKAIAGTTNMVFNSHSALYSPFLDYGYKKSLGELSRLYAKNIGEPDTAGSLESNPPDWLNKRAAHEGKEGILMNQNQMASHLGEATRGLGSKPGLLKGPIGSALDLAATYLMPTPGVAFNAYGRMLEHSPLGMIKAVSEGAKAIGEMKSDNPDIQKAMIHQRESSKAAGRSIVGTAAGLYLGYLLNKNKPGGFSVTPPYVKGHTPFTPPAQGGNGNLQIPGVQAPYQNVNLEDSPFTHGLAMGAYAAEMERKGINPTKDGLNQFMDARGMPYWTQSPFGEVKENMERIAAHPQDEAVKAGLSAIPFGGLIGGIANTLDYGHQREAKTPMERLQNKIPIWRNSLPERK